jgi:MoaA/NifB/PqqE/SkfB family radical SAM enzyme
VELSLHGATAATHERATRSPGSFEATLRGVERLRDRRVPLLVKSLITHLNEHELDRMIALVEGLGVQHQVDATVTPRDDGDEGPLRYRASSEAIALMYRRTAEKGRLPTTGRQEGGVNCGLGRTTLAVDPEGEVYPCLQWRRSSLGNVRESRLRDLWHGSSVREDAAGLARAANAAMLAEGGVLTSFPFCPALAQQRTGDPLVPDAGHAEQARIVASLRVAPSLE